jgi:hypothetical protein
MMNRTDAAQARLDWFALRAQFDHQAKSVAESGLVTGLENIAWLNYRPCAEYPFRDFNPVAPGDLASDGPARRQALKCLAQHLFMTRDFQRLDNLLAVAARHPNDLADGRSSYDALFDGIDNLFEYGGISVNATMVRLAEWRRAMPGSVHADLAEVSALVAWGYAARGVGVANTITAQNLQLFQHRINIAQAALTAMAPRGKKWAQWYAQSIQVNLLGNGKEEERQALFNEGHALFPDDANLDTEMLHALMPRWGARSKRWPGLSLHKSVRGQKHRRRRMPASGISTPPNYMQNSIGVTPLWRPEMPISSKTFMPTPIRSVWAWRWR